MQGADDRREDERAEHGDALQPEQRWMHLLDRHAFRDWVGVRDLTGRQLAAHGRRRIGGRLAPRGHHRHHQRRQGRQRRIAARVRSGTLGGDAVEQRGHHASRLRVLLGHLGILVREHRRLHPEGFAHRCGHLGRRRFDGCVGHHRSGHRLGGVVRLVGLDGLGGRFSAACDRREFVPCADGPGVRIRLLAVCVLRRPLR